MFKSMKKQLGHTSSSTKELHFSHSKLESGEHRIVLLQPGKPTEPIKCTLKHVPLHNRKPPFESYSVLSYDPGDLTSLHPIILDDRPHQVTGNLLAALQRVRLLQGTRLLWIDTLCINKLDVAECNEQTKLVGIIYRQSRLCLVFLENYSDFDFSTPSKAASVVFESTHTRGKKAKIDLLRVTSDGGLREIDSIPETILLLDEAKETDAELTALIILHLLSVDGKDLLESKILQKNGEFTYQVEPSYLLAFSVLQKWFASPWWDQIWSVPAIVLPRSIEIICGQHEVPWHLFVNAADSLHKRLSRFSGPFSSLSTPHISTLRSISTRVSSLEAARISDVHYDNSAYDVRSILELLWTNRHRLAPDPRDKIYAVYGLHISSFADACIFPEYGISARETYIQHTMSLIKYSGTVDSLIGAGVRVNDVSLPSWVQDWTYPGEIDPLEGPYRFQATLPHHAARERHPSGYRTGKPSPDNFTFLMNCSRKGDVLCLAGIEIATVSAIGELMNRDDGEEAFRKVYENWCKLAGVPVYESGNSTEADTSKHLSFWRTINAGVRISLRGPVLNSFHPSPVPRFFIPLRAIDIPPNIYIISLTSRDDPPITDDSKLAAVKLLTHRRRFFLTSSGKYGLGPPGMQAGDRVFILPSGRVPFILRPMKDKSRAGLHLLKIGSGGCYELVGDCYLEGVMDGEATSIRHDQWKMIHLH